jgi:2,4-dienoyl-CoA reductase-like NADH-dependent reductase (Old Yellow Enzyme family)
MKMLEPLNAGGMILPNRIMVPAMVTRLSGEDGFVNKDITDRYVRYAQGEVGLIVVEAMAVHQAKSGPLLRISDDKFVPGLADLVRRIHDTSASKVVPQIIHFMKVSKSGWRQTVDTLSLEEIDRIVEEFGQAVYRAREAGFDGAELHSAHAYTLASFLSRANPRKDDYGGHTLEGRLHLIGRIMENVRRKVGDFPVGIRFLADEFIKDGYTVNDAKLIAVRLAELGAAYLSLSVGGKFEDAIHKEGHVPYPYTGYSGDRCMPGDNYPAVPHAHFSAEIKAYLKAHGHDTAVATTGKISDPDDAERLLSSGQVDIVGIARGLLADPDWIKKVRDNERDRIIRCDYCNVCKHLDGTHMRVICSLWPQGALQAPADDRSIAAPRWEEPGAQLTAVAQQDGSVLLRWKKAPGAIRYDIFRSDDLGNAEFMDAVKVTRWEDLNVLAGRRYRYYIRAYATTGEGSPTSQSVSIDLPTPSYMVRTLVRDEAAP